MSMRTLSNLVPCAVTSPLACGQAGTFSGSQPASVRYVKWIVMPPLVVPSNPISVPSALTLALIVELPSFDVYVLGFSGAVQPAARATGSADPRATSDAAFTGCAASTLARTFGSRRRIDLRTFLAALKLANVRTRLPRLPGGLDVAGARANLTNSTRASAGFGFGNSVVVRLQTAFLPTLTSICPVLHLTVFPDAPDGAASNPGAVTARATT